MKDNNTIKIIAALAALAIIVVGIAYCHNTAEEKQQEKEIETIEQQQAQDGYTVYVSRAGKIHTNPNCSGMKYYRKMGYNDARRAGYDLCQNCY